MKKLILTLIPSLLALASSPMASAGPALNGVVSKVEITIVRGNEDIDAGETVTLKLWEDGSYTLDGSGFINLRVEVSPIFPPGFIRLDPAYGGDLVAFFSGPVET